MKQCDRCDVSIGGNLDKCPLCHAELQGTAEPSVFPRNEALESGSLALKILAFATGACLLFTGFMWLLLSLPGDIVLVVCLAFVLNYFYVRNILIHRPDFLRVVVRYFLILLAIAILWYIITLNQLVTTFVIPSICLVALIFDTVLLVLFRGTFVSGYAKYLLFDLLFGFAPLILVAFNLTLWNVPAYISALVAAVLLLGLLVFVRKQLLAEIRKLFSM